jgi:hypothetical protein
MMGTIDEIVIGDPPEAWAAAGFAVDDDGTCRTGMVRLRLVGREAGKRILGWSLRDVAVDGSLDGLPTEPSGRAPAEPAVHANGCLLIDHVVVATPDLSRTTAALEAAGLALLRTRDADTYGAPMRQCYFRLGEVILEVIGQPEPTGDGPAGFFGLAFTVTDIDATKASLGEHLGAVKDAVQPGRRITTLRHKDLGMSVATAFMSPEP